MGENIINLPEKLENTIGDALQARNGALPNFTAFGPPDLVVLLKHYLPPRLLPIKQSDHSYFHWALGVDVSSSAAIAAYFGSLLESQEKGNFGRGNYKIEKSTYCSYNAFRKADLRVDISVQASGFSIDSYGIDAGGNRVEVDEDFWEETYVCAILRALSGPPKGLRPLRIKDVLTNTIPETHFLVACAERFGKGRKLGASESGDNLIAVDCSNNLLTTALCNYFTKANRFEKIVSYFEPFIEQDPVAAVMVASADALLDKPVRACALLRDALSACPESASIMLALSEILLRNLPVDEFKKNNVLVEILQTILKSISRQSLFPRGWFVLAQALMEMGRYDWALVTMNYAPSLPQLGDSYGSSFVDQIGQPTTFVKLTSTTVANPHISTILQDLDQEFLEMPAEDSLRLLSAPSLGKEGKAAYNLLAEMVARNGWEQLTLLRSRVLERPAQLLRRSKQQLLDSLNYSGSYHSKDDNKEISASSSSSPSAPLQTSQEFSEFVSASQEIEEGTLKKDFGEGGGEGEDEASGTNNNIDNVTDDIKQINAHTHTHTHTHTFHKPSAQAIKRLNTLPTTTFLRLDGDNQLPTEEVEEEDGYKSIDVETATEEVETATEEEEEVTKSGQIENKIEKRESEEIATLQKGKAIPKKEKVDEAIPEKEILEAGETKDILDVIIASETDIDDALSKFLVRATALRCNIVEDDVQVTPMDIDKASSPLIPILGISRTMDLAFHALFQDIKAFHAWKEEAKRKGLKNESLSLKINPQRTTAEWIHLALLCERLNFREDAEAIYRIVAPQNIKALTAVMRFDAEAGDIRNTLLGVTSVLNYYDEKYHVLQPHPEVVSAILRLIATYGLQKVRSIQVPNIHPQVANILLDATRWGAKGYDV